MENFKVALTSAIFSNKFNNVSPGNSTVLFGPIVKGSSDPLLLKITKAITPSGNYKSITNLVDAINKSVENEAKWKTNMLELKAERVKVTSDFLGKLKIIVDEIELKKK